MRDAHPARPTPSAHSISAVSGGGLFGGGVLLAEVELRDETDKPDFIK